MQTESQAEPISASVTAVLDESVESKSKRGGKRPGAGRKPNLAKRLLKGFSREALAEAASMIDCGAVLVGLLKSKKEKTRIEALVFLRDTIIGRPAQDVRHSGGVLHAHTVWRPLESLNLTDEELRVIAEVHKKMLPPVSDASPDAHQNQIESKPALEAEVLEANGEESEEAREAQAGAKTRSQG